MKILLAEDSGKRERQIQMITLVKPPPPPEIEEEPPEPEEQEEKIEEPEPEAPAEDEAPDEPPPGEQLGLDADGSAGLDGFGLKAKKGGRALIGSDMNNAELMHKYAWYTRLIEELIRKKVQEVLDKDGGIPSGDYKTTIRIVLDAIGNIIDYSIYERSGMDRIDKAIEKVMRSTRVKESPPAGMPKAIRLRITSKG
ncbi:MAG: TonB C-terminal domain-containing protein [Thermodesulfobacteriota bacterium]|nr:TonB C-terminal domain-containing protein [Thermodesulfobacteriota bacterium]